MSAARCSICSANFPIVRAGQLCPICEADRLDGLSDATPDDLAELDRRVNLATFERRFGSAEVE